MFGFVIAAAAAIDALAAGVVIGRSTAAKVLPVPVQAAVSQVETAVAKEAAIVVAHNPQHIAAVESVMPKSVADMINSKLDALLAAKAVPAPVVAPVAPVAPVA